MSTPKAVELMCWVSPRLITRCRLPSAARSRMSFSSSSVSSPPTRYPRGVATTTPFSLLTFTCCIPSSGDWGLRRAVQLLQALLRIRLIRIQRQRLAIGLDGFFLLPRVLVALAQPHPRLWLFGIHPDGRIQKPDGTAPVLFEEVTVPQTLPCDRSHAGRTVQPRDGLPFLNGLRVPTELHQIDGVPKVAIRFVGRQLNGLVEG